MDNHLVSYTLFEHFPGVIAFTTTRQVFPETETPRFSGIPVSETLKNREKLAAILGISSGHLIFPRQTHTSHVAEIRGFPEEKLEETDALVTNQPGICLCVQTADCVPILLFDPKQKAVAAIHSGWRGTVKRIAAEAIQKMKSSFQCSPGNIMAVIGPSIGPEDYEVGKEVVEAVRESIPNAELVLLKNSSGKFHLNLWEANRQVLLSNGIHSENIEIPGECTFRNPAKYFSARRNGIDTGRLVSGIMLKD